MDDRQLEILIKNAFDGVRCEKDIKDATLDKIMNSQPKKHQRMFAGGSPTFSPMMRGLAAVVCCVIAFVAVFGVYTTPAAAICLDGEVSMRLVVNRFDRVLDVTAYNDRAKEALREMKSDVKGSVGKNFLKNMIETHGNGDTDVLIISENERLSGAILAKVTTDDSDKEGISMVNASVDSGIRCQVVATKVDGAGNTDAEKNKMTYQRYELFKKGQVLGLGLTEEQVREMSLVNLKAMIAEAELNASNGINDKGASDSVDDIGQGIIDGNHNDALDVEELPEIIVEQEGMTNENNNNMGSLDDNAVVEDEDNELDVAQGENVQLDNLESDASQPENIWL